VEPVTSVEIEFLKEVIVNREMFRVLAQFVESQPFEAESESE
jgi:hypothetical protein